MDNKKLQEICNRYFDSWSDIIKDYQGDRIEILDSYGFFSAVSDMLDELKDKGIINA